MGLPTKEDNSDIIIWDVQTKEEVSTIKYDFYESVDEYAEEDYSYDIGSTIVFTDKNNDTYFATGCNNKITIWKFAEKECVPLKVYYCECDEKFAIYCDGDDRYLMSKISDDIIAMNKLKL